MPLPALWQVVGARSHDAIAVSACCMRDATNGEVSFNYHAFDGIFL